MSTINCIPLEILHNILNTINSTAQLGECRRVCKRWDPAAEVIMFGKKINLNGGDSFARLHNHLHGKPHLAKYIKQMHCELDGDNSAPVMDLLKLSFTPKLEVLSMNASASVKDDINVYLLDMVKRTPSMDYKLKIIPHPNIFDNQKYIDAALAFKDSLQYLYTSFFCRALTNEFGRLSVFKSLVDLQLEIETPLNFFKLESILGNCHRLEYLFLQWNPYIHSYDPGETANWSKKDVQQVSSLREVYLCCPMPLLTKYLVYKYPNIKKWSTRIWYYNPIQFQAAEKELPLMPEQEIHLGFDDYLDAGKAIIDTSFKFRNEQINVSIVFGQPALDEQEADMVIRKVQKVVLYDITVANSVPSAKQKELVHYIGEEVMEDCKFLLLSVDLLSHKKREISSSL